MTGLVCSGVEVTTVVAESGIGRQAAMVVVVGQCGCDGEGVVLRIDPKTLTHRL